MERPLMLEYQRHAMIRALLAERSVVSVGEVEELLGASAATVRRDIAALARRGELRRLRGGAAAIGVEPLSLALPLPRNVSSTANGAAKRAIGNAAAALVEDESSIIINGGTTTLAMAECLGTRSLDVLTNSVPIAAHLMEQDRCRVSLPGGVVYRDQQIILSPFESDTSEKFWASQMFIGAFSVNERGAMESDPLIVQAVVRLMRRAERLVVLADSGKLRQRSSIVTAALSDIHTLVTDCNATDTELSPFRDAGVRVVCAGG